MDAKVWELSESGWYIRFFLWMWNANPQKLNICKLFWGTVFLPISLLVGIPAAAERHSVSGIAVLYLIVGLFWICSGSYLFAGVFLFFALLFLLNNLYQRRNKVQKTNQDRALNFLTEKATEIDARLSKMADVLCKSKLMRMLGSSLFFIFIFIGKVFYYLMFVPFSWVETKVIGKPALLMNEYLKEAKHKFCPIITLIPKNRKVN